MKREREERIAFEVVHAMLTPEWMRSVAVVQALPDGLPPAELEADPRKLEAVWAVSITLETLGYSVYQRMVPLRMVDELLGGTTRVAWRKVGPYFEFERQRAGSQKSMEWFQWLAERLEEHHPSRTSLTIGAQQAHRDWRP